MVPRSIATSAMRCCGRSCAAGASAETERRIGRLAHARFPRRVDGIKSNLEPMPQQTDQCFTVINYGSDFVLKMYRKLEDGINPGREVPEFLCEQTDVQGVADGIGLAGVSA